MTCHYKLSLQYFKCLKSRATRICETEDLETEEDHLKGDLPEEWLSRGLHYKCNEAEDQTGGAADIDRSIQPQKEHLMHDTAEGGP